MKVRIASSNEIAPEDIAAAIDAEEIGEVQIGTPADFAKTLRETEEIVLAQQVVDELAKEGITPDEFVAMLLKSAKATH